MSVDAFRIRHALVSDAAAIVRLGREIDPDTLATEASFSRLLEAGGSETVERLVGELDRRIVAWAPSGKYASGDAWFWIGVDGSERGRGLGSRIYERIEGRLRALGASMLSTTPNDADGRGFLVARGFERTNVLRYSELDPRTVERVPVPPRIRVTALSECLQRPQPLYELFVEGRADVPSETPRPPWTFEEWRRETIESSLIDVDASVVVLEGDEPVALAWLLSDREGGRAEALMAATRRDRRGRGLATLAKTESSCRAAELGITRILTGNDVGNAPMLAVNRKLGFAPTAVVESFEKRLDS